jgi:hypothetical protein
LQKIIRTLVLGKNAIFSPKIAEIGDHSIDPCFLKVLPLLPHKNSCFTLILEKWYVHSQLDDVRQYCSFYIDKLPSIFGKIVSLNNK